jgi:signal peptidase I
MTRAAAVHRPWREGIEIVVMAIVLALVLKGFVVETYRIPTGSMQPTLIGDEDADVKDRILVDRLAYLWRAPERWEVAVFRYPLDRSKTFVKRIAGVGPEELAIQNGDVWCRAPGGEWRIPRRPASVMAEHWKELELPEHELSRWVPKDGAARWSGTGRELVVRGDGTAAFRGGRESIRDGYFDGYPAELLRWLPRDPKESAQNEVGDLRVTGHIRVLPGLERFTVVLGEGGRRYRFEFPGPAAPAHARLRIAAGEHGLPDGAGLPTELDARLTAGRWTPFAVENLDDRLTLELDGEPVLALAIRAAFDQFSRVELEFAGEGADLDRLGVARDVHYTSDAAGPIAVPAGHYFLLGDNTQDSSDSREWRLAVFDVPGAGGSERVRGGWRDRENPRVVGLGLEGGPFTHFVDEWGERHWFPRDETRRAPPEEAPFVPRGLFVGRALAVFWPQDPRRGIWRLKWVK